MMYSENKERFAFTPSHDEAARLGFVGAFKKYVNFDIEAKLQQQFDTKIATTFEQEHGRPPANRKEGVAAAKSDLLYQLWASLTWHSQNLMWSTVQETTDRIIDKRIDQFRALRDARSAGGQIHLSAKPVAKAPITTTEIHRQPGGYLRETREDDLDVALNYTGTVEMYRAAKGMSANAGSKNGYDMLGRFVAEVAQRKAPDLKVEAVLDMGCGTGEQTHAYKRVFPEAKVHGLDCSRSFIRFAHGAAEEAGVAIDFHELDAADTGFADNSFDFITSIIMFHETSTSQLPKILKECHRILKPGGLVLHLDVPYHAHRMPMVKQVTNDWQVRYNGEPFWTGFVDVDMRAALIEAGFAPDQTIADYESAGPATYFFFGGRK